MRPFSISMERVAVENREVEIRSHFRCPVGRPDPHRGDTIPLRCPVGRPDPHRSPAGGDAPRTGAVRGLEGVKDECRRALVRPRTCTLIRSRRPTVPAAPGQPAASEPGRTAGYGAAAPRPSRAGRGIEGFAHLQDALESVLVAHDDSCALARGPRRAIALSARPRRPARARRAEPLRPLLGYHICAPPGASNIGGNNPKSERRKAANAPKDGDGTRRDTRGGTP